MKRILLTTTSLVLAAGVAQADITFSGATGIALIDDNGASSVLPHQRCNRAFNACSNGSLQQQCIALAADGRVAAAALASC